MKPTTHTISPPSNLTDDQRAYFAAHSTRGRFFNPWGTRVRPGGAKDLLKWQLSSNPWAAEKKREEPLTALPNALERFEAQASPKVLWMGHASFLVELDGFRALIDPIAGGASIFVPRRAPLPFELADLPHVDAVLITHGHYDHLDRKTLSDLRDQQGSDTIVVTPLGLGRVIPEGFANVIEIDWWEAVDFGGVDVTLVPAQHWHRRGIGDTNRALWGGWIIDGAQTLYHSGDSGYFGGFQIIGRVYPEIEIAMLPVGAYEPRWFMHPQHMNPEESLQAFDDLGAHHFAAMHWGTFDLTDEPLRQGAERIEELLREQEREAARYHLPNPGGVVSAG